MKIEFHQVLPTPLADSPLAADSCWKQHFHLDTGKFYVAEAASGTGKTTLLSILYGMRHDYSGSVSFDGKNISGFGAAHWGAIRRNKFSIVFQDLRLFPQLTAMENIQIKNSLEKRFTVKDIKDLAELLGIGHRIDQACGKLSLGQQQRVAIIRALAQPFEFLLLDEPFSHLDEANSKKICELITSKCKENNAGLVLTSLGPNNYFEYNGKIII